MDSIAKKLPGEWWTKLIGWGRVIMHKNVKHVLAARRSMFKGGYIVLPERGRPNN